jgi:lanosterol synthase
MQAEKSHTVQTAWSCLALMHAAYPSLEPIKAGLRLIMSRQRVDGEWLQEARPGAGLGTW